MTGTALASWEARAIRRMSSAYLGEYHEASDPGRKPPYLPAD